MNRRAGVVSYALAVAAVFVLGGCTWSRLPDGTTHKTLLTRTTLSAAGTSTTLTSDTDRAVDRIAGAVERAPDTALRLYREGSAATPAE